MLIAKQKKRGMKDQPSARSLAKSDSGQVKSRTSRLMTGGSKKRIALQNQDEVIQEQDEDDFDEKVAPLLDPIKIQYFTSETKKPITSYL
jgi:hypothetical protein